MDTTAGQTEEARLAQVTLLKPVCDVRIWEMLVQQLLAMSYERVFKDRLWYEVRQRKDLMSPVLWEEQPLQKKNRIIYIHEYRDKKLDWTD